MQQLVAQSNFTIIPDTTQFQIGEKNNLKILVPSSVAIKNIDHSSWDTIGPVGSTEKYDKENPNIELLESTDWVKREDGTQEKNISFLVWNEGTYLLDPMVLKNSNGKQSFSNALSFKVISPIQDSLQLSPENLTPIKSIIREPINFLDYIVPLLVILAIIGFFGILIFLNSRHNKRKISTHEIEYETFTPAEIALKKIDALEQEQLWKKEKSKEHQSSFSYILRSFLHRNFKFPALELSSSEIIGAFKKIEDDATQQNQLHRLLNISDLVKFAKAIPGEEMHQSFLKEIKTFINVHDKKEKSLSIEKGDEYAFKKLIYEGLEFDYQLPEKIVHADYKSALASPFERMLSFILDRICFAILLVVSYFIYAALFKGDLDMMNLMIEMSTSKTLISLSIIALVLNFIYFPVAQMFFGASFGKWIFRQKFHFIKGQESKGKYMLRWIISAFSWILGIGYIIAFINQDIQTLHDKAVGTVVLKTEDYNLKS